MTTVIRPATVDDCRILAYHAYLAGKSHVDKSVYDEMFPLYRESYQKLKTVFARLGGFHDRSDE